MLQNRFNMTIPKHTRRASKKLLFGVMILTIVATIASAQILTFLMKTTVNVTVENYPMKIQMCQSLLDTPASEEYSSEMNVPVTYDFDTSVEAGGSFRVHYLVTNNGEYDATFDLSNVALSDGISCDIYDNSNSVITGVGFVINAHSAVHFYYEFTASEFSDGTESITITLGVPELN